MEHYYFTDEHNLFRKNLRAFLDKEVMPHIDTWEEERRVPKELWKKFGDMGYFGINFPEEYGGMDADFFFSVVFLEELSKCYSGGFSIIPTVQQYMSVPYIVRHGSDELKERLLPDAIAGKTIFAIAISEPGAGSDAANIQTKAIRDGDHYIVNGSKTFITNGYYGDYLVTVVKTAPEKGTAGVSLLVIPRNAEGVTATKLEKLGWHASDTAELHFDNVKVDAKNLVGEEGMGFRYLMGGLQLERLAGGVAAIAGCESAMGYTLDYMAEREAFGRPINKFQVLRHRIANLATEITATKFFNYHLCQMHADGHYAVKECSMSKLKATELSDRVMTECLQCFGGYGYMEEYKIARMWRDSRVLSIGAGSSEIMREIIAKIVIDSQSYEQAGDARRPGQAPRKNAASQQQPVTLQGATESVQAKAESAKPFGAKLKFVFAEGAIFLDGTGDANLISNDDVDAPCTISMQLTDFDALLRGRLDPMAAFMAGKFQIDGDMSVATKLQALFR